MLVSLKIPPGVFKNGTDYQTKGRWNEANLVRWFEGTMRPVGGWRQILYAPVGQARTPIQVAGKARGAYAWRSNNSDRYLAIGTNSNLYARKNTQSPLVNITPAGLVAGVESTEANFGYGGGFFGYETYGTSRSEITVGRTAATWSFDNFGEFLVGVQSQDGRLFYWDLMTATAVPVVATAGTTPINNRGVIVTDERFVFLLQAGGNKKRIAWSDQESLFNWQITATTQAGDFELATAGEIQAAVKVRGQTLILTTEDAYAAQYIGPPLVYGFERVGDGCGCISRNAAAASDSAAIWMGEQSFYVYDGGAVRPIPCDVQDFIFKNINRSQVAKVWASHNPDFGEVTFFFPVGMEVDTYATFNYRENHWAIGAMSRTTGVNNAVWPTPIRVGADNFVYEHETGFAYDANSALPFAETGPVEIGEGETVYMCKYLFPDELTQGQVQARFSTKFHPNNTEYAFGPYQMANPTSIRFTGRQVSMRVEGVENADWRVGVPRLDVEPGGLR